MSEPDTLPNECVHHWLLTSPKREVSEATCRLCGAERDFMESDSRSPWNVGRALKPR